MKRIAIEELASQIDALIKTAPKEKILLTRNGEPFAFVSDASRYDWEDIDYLTDPAFWKMIESRRKEKGGISLESVKAELVQREKAGKGPRPVKKPRSKRDRSAA
jgi:hypothetical protein